jgi:hypothetical protein
MLRRSFGSKSALLLGPAFDPYSPKANQAASAQRSAKVRTEFLAAEREERKHSGFRLWNPVYPLASEDKARMAVLTYRDYMGKQYWGLIGLLVVCWTATVGSYVWSIYFVEAAKQFKDEPWSPL